MNTKKNSSFWNSFSSGVGNTLGVKFGLIIIGLIAISGALICNTDSINKNTSPQQPQTQSSADKVFHESNPQKK